MLRYLWTNNSRTAIIRTMEQIEIKFLDLMRAGVIENDSLGRSYNPGEMQLFSKSQK